MKLWYRSIFFLTVLLLFSNFTFADDLVKIGTSGLEGKPNPKKALIYIMRPASYGQLSRTWAFVDDQFIGLNKGKTYFYAYVSPGRHLFWSAAENINSGYLSVEAGKTYYFKQGISPGLMKASVELLMAGEAQGKEWLKKLKYVTTTPKGIARGNEMAKERYSGAKAMAKATLEPISDLSP